MLDAKCNYNKLPIRCTLIGLSELGYCVSRAPFT